MHTFHICKVALVLNCLFTNPLGSCKAVVNGDHRSFSITLDNFFTVDVWLNPAGSIFYGFYCVFHRSWMTVAIIVHSLLFTSFTLALLSFQVFTDNLDMHNTGRLERHLCSLVPLALGIIFARRGGHFG